MKLKDLIDKPQIIGIIGDVNSGKTNLVYHLIKELSKEFEFNLYTYGLRKEIEGNKIFSVGELEKIRDSIIILDEFFTLFDLEDRKKRKQIENTLRLIHHNNNVLILVGLPENFKKFICGKLNKIIYKQSTIEDFINGSSAKRKLINYSGEERGSSVLNLKPSEAILFQENYTKIIIPYLKEYDTKAKNVPLFVQKKSSKKGVKK